MDHPKPGRNRALLAMAIATAGCTSAHGTEVRMTQSPVPIYSQYAGLKPLSVPVGEERILGHELSVTAMAVENDSRCPRGVRCIHSGWATLRVRLRYGTTEREQPLTVQGGTPSPGDAAERAFSRPQASNTAEMGDRVLYFVELRPYPERGAQAPPNEAVFLVDGAQAARQKVAAEGLALQAASKALNGGAAPFLSGLTPGKAPGRWVATVTLPRGPAGGSSPEGQADVTFQIEVDAVAGKVLSQERR